MLRLAVHRGVLDTCQVHIYLTEQLLWRAGGDKAPAQRALGGACVGEGGRQAGLPGWVLH